MFPVRHLGKLAKDGQSIIGTWQVYGPPLPISFSHAAANAAWVIDPSPHRQSFVTVQNGVKLEVLDWGGKGTPLIFLPGSGSTAHVFDQFAPLFTARHHVIAITRRGFGVSSAPPPTLDNYDSDRLGDDVLNVMKQLRLKRPVLAGHSVAGEELSSIGTRHPDEVAGLIYLEAGYGFAYYDADSTYGAMEDASEAIRNLRQMSAGSGQDAKNAIQNLLKILPHLEKDLVPYLAWFSHVEAEPHIQRPPIFDVLEAMALSVHKYGQIKAPVLAIFAFPQKCAPQCNSSSTREQASQQKRQIDAFQAGNPHARVIRLPFASHAVFRSNETDVTREMSLFMDRMARGGELSSGNAHPMKN